jgi:hypothetical protein
MNMNKILLDIQEFFTKKTVDQKEFIINFKKYTKIIIRSLKDVSYKEKYINDTINNFSPSGIFRVQLRCIKDNYIGFSYIFKNNKINLNLFIDDIEDNNIDAVMNLQLNKFYNISFKNMEYVMTDTTILSNTFVFLIYNIHLEK